MIPPLDVATGHLPPGRYRCTLHEIESAFVNDVKFTGSDSRRRLFDGLLRYLQEWHLSQEALGATNVLRSVWVAGSFTSNKLDPRDVDITPLVDGPKLADLDGKPGCGRVKALFGHRKTVFKEFGVEPYPVTWWPLTTLRHTKYSNLEHDYALVRGVMDDFWQRTRSYEGQGKLTVDSAGTRRGYLEVRV